MVLPFLTSRSNGHPSGGLIEPAPGTVSDRGLI